MMNHLIIVQLFDKATVSFSLDYQESEHFKFLSEEEPKNFENDCPHGFYAG